MAPSISTLYLAYRQAKISQFFERRGLGSLDLADYEYNLPENLKKLQSKLASNDGWFSGLSLGDVWLVPKEYIDDEVSGDAKIDKVGEIVKEPPELKTNNLELQARLSPSPEFAIVEVLFLWRFGPAIDALLTSDVLGYRLDVRQGEIRQHGRWLFQYWPTRYQKFRTKPLEVARERLAKHESPIEIITVDLERFYDTINPSFLLNDDFVHEVSKLSSVTRPSFTAEEFRCAAVSLLSSYSRFYRVLSDKIGIEINKGVPIGALTSRLVANASLSPLDRYIKEKSSVISYKRYVDDLIIVSSPRCTEEGSLSDLIGNFVPLGDSSEDKLWLDVDALSRHDSDFRLQKSKCKVYRLYGSEGSEFLRSVEQDFSDLVSERRSFVDESVLSETMDRDLIRSGSSEKGKITVLRDADCIKLQRLELSRVLASLDRVSQLVETEDAQRLTDKTLNRVVPFVNRREDWVDHLEVAFRLLQLTVSVGCYEWAQDIICRMDSNWGCVESLQSSLGSLYYMEVAVSKRRAWVSLRDYLHNRRIEALCSTVVPDVHNGWRSFLSERGLRYISKNIGRRALSKRAKLLAAADLRKQDREDDELSKYVQYENWSEDWLGPIDDTLVERFRNINRFVALCCELRDKAWCVPSFILFLSPRPPSYFDIARRWLYRIETEYVNDILFEDLLAVVNAIRGTNYSDPIGKLLEDRTVVLPADKGDDSSSFKNPRMIVGNLVTYEKELKGASTFSSKSRFGDPKISFERFKRVAHIVERAEDVARYDSKRPSLFVLPELSIPRQWFRYVATHLSKRKIGLVAGVEYLHKIFPPYVYNQVYTVIPGPYQSVATWPWTKRLPAREEESFLNGLGVSFPPFLDGCSQRIVVDSPYGKLSVLICSELLEVPRVSDLFGRVEVVAVPSWNRDTASYDHLVQSIGLHLHAMIGIANNGVHSDCRVWAPRSKRWERDLCRLVERGSNEVVYVDIPLDSLREKHSGVENYEWRPLPPGWKSL